MKREATVRKKENGVKGGQGPSPKKARASVTKKTKVHPTRWRSLRRGEVKPLGGGPVAYLCDRDQRVQDNWALVHAMELGSPVVVVFSFTSAMLSMGERHSCFILKGLKELEGSLSKLNIPFYLLQGEPDEQVPKLVKQLNAKALVTDMSPLREGRRWREALAEAVDVPFHEVDAHNIVPIWVTSEKQEYAARTIRSKVHRNIPTYMREIPKVEKQEFDFAQLEGFQSPEPVDWELLMEMAREKGPPEVSEVTWCKPGEKAALAALKGAEDSFLTKKRMNKYDELRNNPTIPGALSNLSPYLHLGQISAQRCAVEAIMFKKQNPSSSKSVDNFLEELVVRRELSDNFCFYNDLYDSVSGAASWAQMTLQHHKDDKREYLYTREQLERGQTHDDLWNAAQKELVAFGKMHGFMRMYWAKKILEWTESPEKALEDAIYLNDKYSLDGGTPMVTWVACGASAASMTKAGENGQCLGKSGT
eukprot:CAMPEP_0197480958 /NCGR_PEP_ID=MMETSP1309-20131121/44295_1 /TAXON_ID=464262 /ORGANISM="Genus nov. species nov., Strain RCC998" /LENGTH=476 /DNA_ID=CAMNT_0043023065 /DNA_START=197 /DNA_END=1628 /DNA_ORIENTATION=+